MKRSDLICENGVINDKEITDFVHIHTLYRTKYSEIIVDEKLSKRLKSPQGRYVTIYCGDGNCEECLCHILESFITPGKALVVGLGNERICSDSLGAKTLRYVPATSHLSVNIAFKELGMREVYVIETSVTGKTGIESAEQISCISDMIKADIIIIIDSLACSETERLCRTIQITDSGISPGAGVGNNRKAINSRTLGCRVVSIGVPTVIDYKRGGETLMVTPRNIDVVIDSFSSMIGKSISRALNPTLTEREIESLIIR